MSLLEIHREEFLRFITFNTLGATHTCCWIEHIDIGDCFGSQRSVPVLKDFTGDVDDIRREEEELGRRLEDLVVEFQHELDRSREALDKFTNGYWRRRMREECTPSEEEIRNLTSVGCIFDQKGKFRFLHLDILPKELTTSRLYPVRPSGSAWAALQLAGRRGRIVEKGTQEFGG